MFYAEVTTHAGLERATIAWTFIQVKVAYGTRRARRGIGFNERTRGLHAFDDMLRDLGAQHVSRRIQTAATQTAQSITRIIDEKVMATAGSMRNYIAVAIAVVGLVAMDERADADALVVTRAMQASTIAEVFIEGEQIRVKIEVGAADVDYFANALPDELYEKITGQTQPLEKRLRSFFESDWQILADGESLTGRLEHVVPAKRVVRDEVTGETLATQPKDAEVVIRVTLCYQLEGRPQTLTIRPPRIGDNVTASIGFVCYHDGLPVNDFRYMPGEVTLDLDWSDPWYSRFRHPNLRRQFDAPLSAYLYVEPYEVRKEIIVRPKDLQVWLDLGLRADGVIPVDQQEELKKRIAQFLSAMNPVSINGRRVEGQLDRIHFIHRTLRTAGIIEPPIDLDTTSATLGVIFVYPIDELPEAVSMKWELFSPKIQSIPAVASDEAGGLPSKVTPDDPVLVWKNYLTNPTIPRMTTVAQPLAKRQFAIPLLSALCGVVLVVMLVVLGRQWSMGQTVSRTSVKSSIALFAFGFMSLPFANVNIVDPFADEPSLSEDTAQELLSGLLHNVYRSFDHHDESLIYDRLAKSIAGELISDVYLETRESMEVKNQGGLRISVKEVNVTELELADENVSESTFRCRWRVAGWIGHWGHVHTRANEHVAFITVAPRDGKWKITGIEMLDEQPLEPPRISGLLQQGAGA